MKILFLDIETSPNTAHVWGLFKQTVSISQLLESSYVLCWAAKWYDSDEILFDSLYHSTKKQMLRRVYKLLEEADVVVHYNGTKFDIPTLNKEFLLQNITPPSPYKQVDLLKVARNQFKFPSNKLDYVAQALGLGKKHKHEGHELWVKCMNGDSQAWETMEAYNRQDVLLLEKVYEKLKPWIKNHPNWSVHAETTVCPNCGGSHYQYRGTIHTALSTYKRLRCNMCGTWFRENRSVKTSSMKYITIK